MNEEKERRDILTRKAQHFYDTKERCHISKKNGWFHNGTVSEFSGDLILFNDRKLGIIHIYLLEILEIQKERLENE